MADVSSRFLLFTKGVFLFPWNMTMTGEEKGSSNKIAPLGLLESVFLAVPFISLSLDRDFVDSCYACRPSVFSQ